MVQDVQGVGQVGQADQIGQERLQTQIRGIQVAT